MIHSDTSKRFFSFDFTDKKSSKMICKIEISDYVNLFVEFIRNVEQIHVKQTNIQTTDDR